MRAKRQDTKDANKPQHSQHCCAAPCRGVMNHVKDFRMSHDTTQLPPHTMSLWHPGVSTSSELAALLASKTNIFQIKWHLKRTTICIESLLSANFPRCRVHSEVFMESRGATATRSITFKGCRAYLTNTGERSQSHRLRNNEQTMASE